MKDVKREGAFFNNTCRFRIEGVVSKGIRKERDECRFGWAME